MSSAEDKLLNQLVEKTFVPTVIVRTTPAVENACQKNNLSFIDMLRPYEVINKELYTRTVKEYESYAIRNFRIRFKMLDELSAEYGKDADSAVLQQTEKIKKERALDNFLQRVVSESYVPNNDDPFVVPKVENEEKLQKQMKQGINFTPWFDRYREEYLNSFYLSDHETWDHPVACVSVVSSDDPDPVRTSKELYSSERPPKLFSDRNVDPDVFRFYVMLHDAQNGPADNKVKNQFRKMNEAFSAATCRLLIINSSAGADNVIDIWTPAIPRRELYGRNLEQSANFGRYLSTQDISYISVLVDEIVTAGILPSMERKIKSINTTIVTKKKGFRGTFSSWFGTKKKDETTTSGRYTYQTQEIQIRRMADYCFMLRDYDTALSTYKIISSDFKGNKDLKHYAGTMEFIALCTLFYNQGVLPGVTVSVRKDVESSLDLAFSNYNMVGENKYALRAALFLALVCKGRSDQKRAAEIYTKATSLEPTNHLLNAQLFEQTAVSYLIHQSPRRQLKKFALFLVLAGHRFYMQDRALKDSPLINTLDYSKLQTASHSYRCYKTVLQVHYKKDWTVIYEHMSGILGDLSLELSNSSGERAEQLRLLKDSIQFIHNSIGGTTVSGKSSIAQGPEDQRRKIKKLLDIVSTYMMQASDEKSSPLESPLHLPEIDVQSYRVLLNQYGNVPNCSHEFPTQEWREMEESFVRKIRSPFHVFPWERNNSLYKEPSVVFEPIFVEVSVRNILYIPIRISSLQVVASFKPSEPLDATDGFKIVPEEVIMKPGQVQSIRLSIIPLVEGELTIKGVKWMLEDVIEGYKDFEAKGRRLNETSHQKTNVVYEQDNRLCFRIVANMPLLSVDAFDKPSELLHGQIFQSAIVLKNVGGIGLTHLKVKVSHPQFVAFGKPSNNKGEESEDDAASVFLQPFAVSSLHHKFTHDLTIADMSSFIDGALSPNETIRIPVYFRGHTVGTHACKFLFYYESEVASTVMKFRLYKLETSINVADSLSLYHFTQPSCASVNEFILGLTATNQRRSLTDPHSTIQIDQVSAVSPNWKLTPLNFSPGTVADTMIRVNSGESTTLYFKISKIEDKSQLSLATSDDDEVDSLLYHESLFLTEPEHAIDSSAYPYIDFLYRDYDHALLLKQQEQKKDAVVDYPFLKEHGLALLLFWTCGKIRGQSQILNTQFVPEREIPLKMHMSSNLPNARGPNASCPISVTLHYNDSICHKFNTISQEEEHSASTSILIVPIHFSLSNISPDMQTDFTLELISPDKFTSPSIRASTAQQLSSVASESENAPFLWMGNTRLHFKHVQPGENMQFTVKACFFGPGKYNLNQFRITWTCDAVTEKVDSQLAEIMRPARRPVQMNFNSMQYIISIDDEQ